MTFTNVLSAMNIDLRKLYFEKEFLPITLSLGYIFGKRNEFYSKKNKEN